MGKELNKPSIALAVALTACSGNINSSNQPSPCNTGANGEQVATEASAKPELAQIKATRLELRGVGSTNSNIRLNIHYGDEGSFTMTCPPKPECTVKTGVDIPKVQKKLDTDPFGCADIGEKCIIKADERL